MKPKWIKPSRIKTYDNALSALKMIDSGKRRAEKSTYEAILTQVFQKYIRSKGDCVLRQTAKRWTCSSDITAGHVISRAVKEFKWDERNCYPQCSACNKMHNYYPFVFEDWCKSQIGDEFDKMKEKARRYEFFDLDLEIIKKRIHDLLIQIG
jgi:hypothetical protein